MHQLGLLDSLLKIGAEIWRNKTFTREGLRFRDNFCSSTNKGKTWHRSGRVPSSAACSNPLLILSILGMILSFQRRGNDSHLSLKPS
ncbi:hypothetical protein VTO42DRAFT_1545 [Malbranchea cinnamomea]